MGVEGSRKIKEKRVGYCLVFQKQILDVVIILITINVFGELLVDHLQLIVIVYI